MLPRLLLGVSGILAGIGILYPFFWWVSIAGVGLLIYLLRRDATRTVRQLFLDGWIFGGFFCGTAIIWFWTVIPLDWLSIDGLPKSIGLVLFCWGAVSVVLGAFFGLYSLAVVKCRPASAIAELLFAASLFTLIQYLQMWGCAILTIGGSSLMGPHFSPPLLGYALVGFSPLLQLAQFGGIYALTFTAALLGALAHWLFERYAKKGTILFVLVGFSCIALTALDDRFFFADILRSSPNADTAYVALVSTNNFPVRARSRADLEFRNERARTLVSQWAPAHELPDILVFPEDAHAFSDKGDAAAFAQKIFATTSPLVIDSALSIVDGKKHSYMSFYGPNGLLGTYEKMFMVPDGEYIVWASAFAIHVLIGNEAADRMIANFNVERGNAVRIIQSGGMTIGPLFCSDVLSPSLYRTLAEEGAEILVNAASQTPFHGSNMTDRVVFSIAKVRSVETGRYFVLAGNVIPSIIISDSGKTVAHSEKGTDSVLDAQVPLLSGKTVYVRLGDLVLLFPLILCLWLFVLIFRQRWQDV